jgi:polar amino acid transport system substrate-binding protein
MFHRPKHMRRNLLCVVLGLTLMAGRVEAADIRLAGPDFLPYYEMDNGRMVGALALILEKIWSNTGASVQGQVFPATRLMSNLIDGSSDSSLLVRNPALDDSPDVIRSPVPISELVLNVYTVGRPAPPIGQDDLRGSSVIVMRGYGYGGLRSWMDQKDNRISLIEANNVEAALSMLIAKRARFALLYDVNFTAARQALGSQPDDLFATSLQRVPTYIYISRKSVPNADAVMDRIMQSYADLVARGVLKPANQRPEDVLGSLLQ